jgi:tRNA(adenine34) deaminase
MDSDDKKFMRAALKEAQNAFLKDEVPVGAVIVLDGKIIARAHNLKESLIDPTAHAEVLVIKKACKKLNNWRLTGCTLYSTLEPCPMCAGAILHARMDRLVFGAMDPKGGAVGSVMNILNDERLHHQVEVECGLFEDECKELLDPFFKSLRSQSSSE